MDVLLLLVLLLLILQVHFDDTYFSLHWNSSGILLCDRDKHNHTGHIPTPALMITAHGVLGTQAWLSHSLVLVKLQYRWCMRFCLNELTWQRTEAGLKASEETQSVSLIFTEQQSSLCSSPPAPFLSFHLC